MGGGQFDFVGPSTRTMQPHGDASYMQGGGVGWRKHGRHPTHFSGVALELAVTLPCSRSAKSRWRVLQRRAVVGVTWHSGGQAHKVNFPPQFPPLNGMMKGRWGAPCPRAYSRAYSRGAPWSGSPGANHGSLTFTIARGGARLEVAVVLVPSLPSRLTCSSAHLEVMGSQLQHCHYVSRVAALISRSWGLSHSTTITSHA